MEGRTPSSSNSESKEETSPNWLLNKKNKKSTQ